jgi:cytochrome c553
MPLHPVPAVIAALVALAAGSAVADPATALLAGGCANCHGPGGRSPGSIPGIAGVPAAVLEAQLLAFRGDQIPGTTVMNRIAKGFSEAELKALAAWYAAQPR